MRIDVPICSSRLQLRTLTPHDVSEHYLAWMRDPQVMRYLESRFQDFDHAMLRQFVETLNNHPDELLLGIFLVAGDRHIGNIRLGPINRAHRHAPVGLLIGERDCWGKGFATEAIAAVSAYAFDALGIEKVFAGCYAGNEGSRRAFLKAGFSEEARFPRHWVCEDERVDHVQLGLCKADSRTGGIKSE